MDQTCINLIKTISRIHSIPDGYQFTDETHLVEDLGFDSLGLIKLALLIEEEFHLELDPESLDFENLVLFKNLLETVNKHKL